MSAQARTQGLASHPVAFFLQLGLEALGTVAAFVVLEHGEHLRLPSRLVGPHRPRRLRAPPGIVAAGYHVQHLAQLLGGVMNALRDNEMQRAHEIRGCEKMAMVFLKCPAPAPSVY